VIFVPKYHFSRKELNLSAEVFLKKHFRKCFFWKIFDLVYPKKLVEKRLSNT
jgi:hypothetical protein